MSRWDDGSIQISEEAQIYLTALAELVRTFGRAVAMLEHHTITTGEHATAEMIEGVALAQQALMLSLDAVEVNGISQREWRKQQEIARVLLLSQDPDETDEQ